MTNERHPDHNRRKEDKYMAMERHFTTIISALILGAILWVGSSLTESIETTAKTEVRLGNIEEDIAELKTNINKQMSDRFTGKDASTLIKHYDRRFSALEKWKEDTEKRIDKLEQTR